MNDFTRSLGENINKTTANALLLTIVSDPARSFGDILDALEKEPELNYLLDTFRSLTVADVVDKAAMLIAAEQQRATTMAAAEPVITPTAPEPTPKKSKPKKDKKPPKRATAAKKDTGKIDLSDPNAIKTYEAMITKFLRGSGANEPDNAVPASAIRSAVGGSPDQLRKRLNALIEADNVSFVGKARGTKYFLA